MDGVEGLVVDDCESAGGEGADEEGTEEAWGVGDGDGVDVGPGEVGGGEGGVEDGVHGFEVGAGGDFGDDSAVLGEDVDLGDDGVGEEFDAVGGGGGVAFEDGDGGFVAA